MDKIAANAAAQIQSAEDERIFDMMESMAKTCQVKSHAAHGRPLEECDEIECITRHVHES